jgi:hypothetical protein
MRRLLIATDGKVFTLESAGELIEHTKIRQFVTRTPR